MAESAENESEQTPESDGPDATATDVQSVDAEPEQAAAPEQGARTGSRRRSRTRKAAKPGEQLSPEQRHARRVELRRAKAVRRRARRVQEREKASARPGSTAPQELPAVHAAKRGAPKERQGVVVSSKADKTITVRIDVARKHRRYEKTVRSSSTLHAHDERNDANEGDVVRVVESRPMSKTKRWQLLDVLERAR